MPKLADLYPSTEPKMHLNEVTVANFTGIAEQKTKPALSTLCACLIHWDQVERAAIDTQVSRAGGTQSLFYLDIARYDETP